MEQFYAIEFSIENLTDEKPRLMRNIRGVHRGVYRFENIEEAVEFARTHSESSLFEEEQRVYTIVRIGRSHSERTPLERYHSYPQFEKIEII